MLSVISEFERKCQDLDNEARKSCMGLGDVPDVSPAPLKPHPSCLNSHSGQYIWRFTAHSAILSLLSLLHLCPGESYLMFPDPCPLVSWWHRHKVQMLIWLPLELLWTPAVTSSSYRGTVEPAKKDLSHNCFICVLPLYRWWQIPEGLWPLFFKGRRPVGLDRIFYVT